MPARVPIIRNSERRSFGRCPQQWWWGWRCGLRLVNEESVPLWFGTGYHIALAAWYCGPGLKRGPHPAETFAAWAGDEIRYVKTSNRLGNGAEAMIEERLVPAKELGVTLLDQYIQKYGKDDSWSILQPEQTFQVDIPHPTRKGAVLAILAGTYDLIYRDIGTGRLWVGEHKTAKAIQTDHLPLDNQAGTYWAIADQNLRHAGLLKPREGIAGIMYNFSRKALPDPRPRNADGHYTNKPTKADYVEALAGVDGWRADELEKKKLADLESIAVANFIEVLGGVSKNQPAPLFVRHPVQRTAKERAQQIKRIQDEAVVMEEYRRGRLPILKNATNNCQWDCSFYHMCLLHEADADWEEYRGAMYRVQDPYADHRKSTEE